MNEKQAETPGGDASLHRARNGALKCVSVFPPLKSVLSTNHDRDRKRHTG